MNTVGEKIRFARIDANVNRSALGRNIGTIYQRIREWEDGINHPKYENVKKIADSLHVDIRYFMDPDVGKEDLELYKLEIQDCVDVRLNERVSQYIRSLAKKKKSSAANVVNDLIESMIAEEQGK